MREIVCSYKTHCIKRSSTNPGTPRIATTRAFHRFSPRVIPVNPAVRCTTHNAANPSSVFTNSFNTRRSGC